MVKRENVKEMSKRQGKEWRDNENEKEWMVGSNK
jgi:hypothetical protein